MFMSWLSDSLTTRPLPAANIWITVQYYSRVITDWPPIWKEAQAHRCVCVCRYVHTGVSIYIYIYWVRIHTIRVWEDMCVRVMEAAALDLVRGTHAHGALLPRYTRRDIYTHTYTLTHLISYTHLHLHLYTSKHALTRRHTTPRHTLIYTRLHKLYILINVNSNNSNNIYLKYYRCLYVTCL